MGGEWRIAKLRDVLGRSGYIRGPFGSALRRPELKTHGIPVYEQQHAITGIREFRFYIDEQKYATLQRFTVQEGDLIISCSGTLGRVSMISRNDPKGIISQALLILRPDTSVVHPKYLYYFMSSKQGFNSIAEVSTGSVQVNIARRDIIENTDLPLPPLPEQHAIACILGALDDKIELNRRMNETLEAMARAIFKSWFVDFDPVRAKAAGQQPSGLAPHIADLFPDEFEASELREIPKGWEVTSVGDVCEFAYGKSLKESKRKSGNIPVLGSNGQIGWHDIPLVTGPGIVIGRKGNPGIVTWVNSDFFPIDTTFYVVPHLAWVPLSYLYYALMGLDLPRLSADSAVPGLNRNIAYMSWLLLPSREILEVFARHTRLIMDRVYQGEQENRTLAALRDTLLPKLISGALRVPDAERIVGRCL